MRLIPRFTPFMFPSPTSPASHTWTPNISIPEWRRWLGWRSAERETRTVPGQLCSNFWKWGSSCTLIHAHHSNHAHWHSVFLYNSYCNKPEWIQRLWCSCLLTLFHLWTLRLVHSSLVAAYRAGLPTVCVQCHQATPEDYNVACATI